jgi:hypothetical protein
MKEQYWPLFPVSAPELFPYLDFVSMFQQEKYSSHANERHGFHGVG